MGCVYKLTSPSGKSYIGITSKTFDYRWSRHINDTNAGVYRPLANAIRKYGADRFITEVLIESEDREALCKYEQDYINSHNTFTPNGYNCTFGGDGMLGHNPSEETRQKMSIAKKGKPFPNPPQGDEWRKKAAETMRGHKFGPMSDDHKKKISEGNKRRHAKPENRATTLEVLAKATAARKKVFEESDIVSIRNDYADGIRIKQLALKYGTDISYMSKIVHNKCWKNIDQRKVTND